MSGNLLTVRTASALLAALFLAVIAGCDSPPDEAWLRIIGFQDVSGVNTSSIEAPLGGGTTTVTALLENNSLNVGSDSGVGITVTSVRIEYGGGLPGAEYPVTLFIPAPAKDGAGENKVEVPIAPASLKAWVKANKAVPQGGLAISASVRFSAHTEEGRDLDASGGLLVTFTGP
jgi:hypothetical protein